MNTDRTEPAINPGRWPFHVSSGLRLVINQKVMLRTPSGKCFHAIYLGRSRLSADALDRFKVPDSLFTARLPLNIPVEVVVGRRGRVVAKMMLAVKRPDEGTVLMIKEDILPCVE